MTTAPAPPNGHVVPKAELHRRRDEDLLVALLDALVSLAAAMEDMSADKRSLPSQTFPVLLFELLCVLMEPRLTWIPQDQGRKRQQTRRRHRPPRSIRYRLHAIAQYLLKTIMPPGTGLQPEQTHLVLSLCWAQIADDTITITARKNGTTPPRPPQGAQDEEMLDKDGMLDSTLILALINLPIQEAAIPSVAQFALSALRVAAQKSTSSASAAGSWRRILAGKFAWTALKGLCTRGTQAGGGCLPPFPEEVVKLLSATTRVRRPNNDDQNSTAPLEKALTAVLAWITTGCASSPRLLVERCIKASGYGQGTGGTTEDHEGAQAVDDEDGQNMEPIAVILDTPFQSEVPRRVMRVYSLMR